MKFFSKILFLFIASLLFFPSITHAAIDPRCFTQKQCIDYRTQTLGMDQKTAAEGFFHGTREALDACGKEDASKNLLGFCAPGQTAKTKVKFFGSNTFENVGDFIAKAYEYSIFIAIILAVLMIVVAGLQITGSGGNSSTIDAGKKRILSAITGLLLVLFGFTILGTINPNLLKLRIPDVWLINTQGLTTVKCGELQDGAKLAEAIDIEQKLKFKARLTEISPFTDKNRVTSQTNFNLEKKDATCGSQYFVDGTGGQTCRGDICPKDSSGATYVCYKPMPANYDFSGGSDGGMKSPKLPFDLRSEITDNPSIRHEALSYCGKGNIVGTIYNGNIWETTIEKLSDNYFYEIGKDLITRWWSYPWTKRRIELQAVCKNGKIIDISTSITHNPNHLRNMNRDTLEHSYGLSIVENNRQSLRNHCSDDEGTFGFVLRLALNTFGQDEIHYLGRDPDTKNVVDLGVNNTIVGGDNTWGGDSVVEKLVEANQDEYKKHFFTSGELLEGINFNIDVSKIPHVFAISGPNTSNLIAAYGPLGFCENQTRDECVEYKKRHSNRD